MRGFLAGAIAGLCGLATFTTAQADTPPGAVVLGPPVDVMIEVTAGPEGAPVLAETEYRLALGGYYRFNFVCPENLGDSGGFHFEADDLIADSHLRVLSVGEMEFHAQGLSFRAIECEEAGSARFSFHPMRRGSYDLLVRDQAEPPHEAIAHVTVE